ncbi:hypothetical protein ACTOB_000846 [Actinoplanes oblitus]|uniref:Uncharacterized protein n=1 Tax=Actinoplanes oblitus TaxID=3040509 RepID=A0ABY8WIU5_9ACTN|nr:hypothetical protein [Actinoplanes oblitus]WIM97337.1 hypothetical protein ACTOB_000846 [Actinoplanes oblitus]
MNSDILVDRLWGGKLESTWFDVAAGRADLVISTTSDDDVRRFRVVADSLREFRFETDGGGRPWFYAEVTSAFIEEVAEGLVRLTLVLWSEAHEMVISAKSITIEEMLT